MTLRVWKYRPAIHIHKAFAVLFQLHESYQNLPPNMR